MGRVCIISVLTDEVRYLKIDEAKDMRLHTHTHTVWRRHGSRTLEGVCEHSLVFAYLQILIWKIVCCKVTGFWSLLWENIWFRENFLELNSNTVNWLQAFKNNIFTLEQLKGIFSPLFSLFCSAKQFLRFSFSFPEPLLIPDHNNRPTWKLIQVMAQPSAWPAVQKPLKTLLENVCTSGSNAVWIISLAY